MPTTVNGLAYPDSSAHTRIWDHLHDAANSVDARYGLAVATWANLAAISAPYKGMRVWVDSMLGLAVYDGTKWRQPEIYVAKAADESVPSSAALQSDDHLIAAINSVGTYLIDLGLYVSGNTAGDIRVGANFPAGTCRMSVDALDPTATATNGTVSRQTAAITTGVDPGVGIGTLGTDVFARIRFVLVATAAGTFTFRWAQSVSNASASIVRAGSHLHARQVA